jgi:PUA domain protein
VETRDCPILQTLILFHRYPFIMPHMQCDKGSIRHILSGSDIMCPGLTSLGGNIDDFESEKVVAIMAEGK